MKLKRFVIVRCNYTLSVDPSYKSVTYAHAHKRYIVVTLVLTIKCAQVDLSYKLLTSIIIYAPWCRPRPRHFIGDLSISLDLPTFYVLPWKLAETAQKLKEQFTTSFSSRNLIRPSLKVEFLSGSKFLPTVKKSFLVPLSDRRPILEQHNIFENKISYRRLPSTLIISSYSTSHDHMTPVVATRKSSRSITKCLVF